MSADADAPAEVQNDESDRGAILDLLEDGRVYDAENEKVRIQWIRALAYSVNVYRQTLTDKDLDEMNDRLEALEAQQDGSGL